MSSSDNFSQAAPSAQSPLLAPSPLGFAEEPVLATAPRPSRAGYFQTPPLGELSPSPFAMDQNPSPQTSAPQTSEHNPSAGAEAEAEAEAEDPCVGVDAQGRDAVFRAIERGAPLVEIQALARDVAANALCRTTFLKGLAHAAATRSDGAIMEFALRFGASATAADVNGSQPLHECHKGDSPLAAELLLAAGADINAQDCMEMTPLMSAAVSRPNSAVALLLISRGAILDGALDLALSTPQPNAVVAALLAAGARSEPHALSRTLSEGDA